MQNEKTKKPIYILCALVCGAAFVGVGGFLIDFSNGHLVVNVLFSLLAVILACATSYLGKSALYKETAQWDSRRWAKDMVLPIILTIALILYIK
ncbi:MAG: hypothetical protein KBI01_04275 [Oscillospiraceae bacterium]|nr:hypothetical protein [Oscillospiraceae bacterium]